LLVGQIVCALKSSFEARRDGSSKLSLEQPSASFFGKHGERFDRFDRCLYAELESITRVSLALRRYGVLKASLGAGKAITSVERGILEKGQQLYYDFP